MNKRLKWGLTAVVLAGAAALGAYSMLPQENEELAAADKVSKAQPKKNILNVNAIIAKPQTHGQTTLTKNCPTLNSFI